MNKTPLEALLQKKIGAGTHNLLTRERIEKYQAELLKTTVDRAKKQSRFYRQHLKNIDPAQIRCVDDVRILPFTTAQEFRRDPAAYLCGSQQQISRIVTVATSGTTGEAKRIFFTADDQEAIIDFFHHGMANLADKGDRVVILLPGELPGSVGDLLQKALNRLGAVGIKHGPVTDPAITISVIARERANVLVGIPVQILALARHPRRKQLSAQLKSVLLSTDYVPRAIVNVLENTWNCRVFNHYGAAEMGLGAAVQCEALGGYHLREADLLFEIINGNGQPAAPGEYGEIVFTSLTAQGTPLIRYRTGDVSRFITSSCPCGTVLSTMDLVSGRIAGELRLNNGAVLRQGDFDEALFPLEGVLDFQVLVTRASGHICLDIAVNLADGASAAGLKEMYDALNAVPGLRHILAQGEMAVRFKVAPDRFGRGTAKRNIIDGRHSVTAGEDAAINRQADRFGRGAYE